MTPNLLNMIHKQKSLRRRIVRSNRQNKNLISEHRVLRNQTNNLYRQLKNRYFQQVLQNYKNSPRHFWNIINHITGRKSQHFLVTAELCDLTDHFQSLLFQPGLSRELPNGPATKHSLCEFSPVSSREVRQLLKDLDPSKAAGPDEIPPAALKMVADEIAFPLSILFNESLATGVLPDEFKIGHLHPLPAPEAREIQLKGSIELSRNHVDMHPLEGSGESRASSDIPPFRIIRGPIHFTVWISPRPFML